MPYAAYAPLKSVITVRRPRVERMKPIVFLGRWQTIRAPTVPKRPKAMPVKMIWAYCNRFPPSRNQITVAARIKDTQMPQATQATRCPAPGPAIFPATLYEECIYLLLPIESVGQAFIYSAYAYYHITLRASQKRYGKLTHEHFSYPGELLRYYQFKTLFLSFQVCMTVTQVCKPV